MATTLLKSVRAANALQKVARCTLSRLSLACSAQQQNRQLQSTTHAKNLLSLQTKYVPSRSVSGMYGTGDTPLKVKDVQARVLKVCGEYDKINADKVTLDSHFVNDLGLDSLDIVEVVMQMEDEFGFEIPDQDAERLLTPGHIAQYVCDREDVYDEV